MFCPQCEAEYRPEIRRCPVCEVDLVDSLEGLHDAPEMVVVFETNQPAELLAACSALDGAGIPYQSPDLSSVPGTMLGSLDPAGRPGHIQVPVERVTEARTLLAEVAQTESAAAEADD